MILFLVLIYVALLSIAVKMGLVKLTLGWKLSPAFVGVFLTIALFIPLQFWAPSGPVTVGNYTIGIVPQVTGEVIEVPVEANEPINKGDVLFRIDPVLFQAAVDNAEAAVELSQIRVKQEERLTEQNVGRLLDLDTAKANLKQAEAGLVRANFDLNATTVMAPHDGYVTNLTLRPGARAVNVPLAPAMAFIESGRQITGALILQNHLRYIEEGQPAEIAFKMYPGQVFDATVEHIIPARATGHEGTSGIAFIPQIQTHAPFGVRLILGEEAAALDLPSGATGSVTIYSNIGGMVHIIRKIELRLTAIMNYVNPF